MAERLARRLDGNASDAEALVIRLAPVGEAGVLPAPAAGDAPGARELRLVEPGEAARAERGADDESGDAQSEEPVT